MSFSHNVSAALAIALTTGSGCPQNPVTPAPPGSATLHRDVWGAPHVYAEREEDGYSMVGFRSRSERSGGATD